LAGSSPRPSARVIIPLLARSRRVIFGFVVVRPPGAALQLPDSVCGRPKASSVRNVAWVIKKNLSVRRRPTDKGNRDGFNGMLVADVSIFGSSQTPAAHCRDRFSDLKEAHISRTAMEPLKDQSGRFRHPATTPQRESRQSLAFAATALSPQIHDDLQRLREVITPAGRHA